MSFGLTNGPVTFQRALDLILTKFKWKAFIIFLDDIIIFLKTVDEHIKHLDEIGIFLAEALPLNEIRATSSRVPSSTSDRISIQVNWR